MAELSTLGSVVGALATSNGAAKTDLSNVLGSIFASVDFTATGATTARDLADRFKDWATLEDFGAVGDGSTDDTAAVTAMHEAGFKIRGRAGKTYAVTGNVTFTTGSPWLENCTFKQLSPNATDRRTLRFNDCSKVTLKNVVVDRNGSGTGGAVNDAAGIWINGCEDLLFEDVEVYGDDKGSGIVIVDSSGRARGLYVHDIRHGDASSTAVTDDQVNGIFLIRSNIQLESPRVYNLTGQWSGQAEFTRYTRGITVAGSGRVTITNPQIDTVDQGIDCTGSDNPNDTAITGGSVANCYTWGVKLANTVTSARVQGVEAYRCRLGGFVVSGGAGATTPQSQDISFVACHAEQTGYGSTWTGSNDVAAFRVLAHVDNPTYPRNVTFSACKAIDTGSTMEYGFLSDAAFGGNGDTWVQADSLCSVRGATVADYSGLNQGVYERRLASDQSIPNNAYTAVSFDATDFDRMGGAGSSAAKLECTRSGLYMLSLDLELAGNSTGQRLVRVTRSGSLVRGSLAEGRPTASALKMGHSFTFLADKGDEVQVEVFQDSGGALNVLGGNTCAKLVLLQGGRGRS